MSGDTSRRFDAPSRPSALAPAFTMIRRRWRVLCALIVVAALIDVGATGFVYADAVGQRMVDASIGSISMLVTVDAQASQADADALGPLIRATPGIAEVAFRSKDDAIKSLVARGLPAPEGRNPLPDVWIARLNPTAVNQGRPVATAVADVQRALSALPRVQSVTTDDAWVRSADKLAKDWRSGRQTVGLAAFAMLALMLAGAAYLAGKALVRDPPELQMRALAIVAVTVSAISLMLGLGIAGSLVGLLNNAVPGTLQVEFGPMLVARSGVLAGVFLVSMLLIAVGLAVRRQWSHSVRR